jgi:hypothetical protein
MKDIRLTMSDDEKNWVSEARQHAETVTNCALSMLGESLGRASAYSKNPMKSEVFIDLESKTVSGCLYHELIKAADNHFGWSPELIAHIKADSKDFQQRLSETLYYLTREYYVGDVGEEGEDYGIFRRY